ncbi:hypothetical protein JCM19992_08360 [Thermostilla marina]
MDGIWTVTTAILGITALVQAALLLLQTYEHRRFSRSRRREIPRLQPRGKVLLIVPCRGIDTDFESNLETLFRQDYPAYEIRFVLDSLHDPAYEVIRRVIDRHPERRCEIFCVGRSRREAQKVHNLRMATASLPDDVEILAFADSDAAAGPHWLKALTARLNDVSVGASTGYRMFVPVRVGWATAVVQAVNAGYTTLLARRSPNMLWGGSWAMRRDLFETLDVRRLWEGALCEDLVLTKVLHRVKLAIEYEPACLAQTAIDFDWSSAWEFATRQFFLLRRILPGWWAAAVGLQALPYLAAVALIAHAACFPQGRLAAGIALLGLWTIHSLRGYLARTNGSFAQKNGSFTCRVPRDAPAHDGKDDRNCFRWCWFDPVLWPVAGLFAWTALIAVTFRREIVWRGITYRLRRDGTVEVCHPIDESEGDDTVSIESFAATTDRKPLPTDSSHSPVRRKPAVSTVEISPQ